MNLDIETLARLISPLLTLILGALIKHYTQGRAKLVSFIRHVSAFTLQDEKRSQVYAHSVVVRNTGNRPAKNIRIGHHTLPINVTVYPPVQYSVNRNPEGAGEILIPVLVAREQVTISYLYFPPLTWGQINAYAKSDEGSAKILNVIPMPQPPRSVLWAVWSLVFLGASFIVYWLVRLVALLV